VTITDKELKEIEDIQIKEYELVEKPALDLLEKKLGYTYIDGRTIEKETNDVFLKDILKKQIKKLNHWMDDTDINKVIREITLVQSTSPIEANQELYYKLVNHISIKKDLGQGKKSQTVKVIDWNKPENNEFTAVNQFLVKSAHNPAIIPDLILFVNGIPVSVIECKAPQIEEPIDQAIQQLTHYKKEYPNLFIPNQIVVATSRYQAKYTSTYAPSRFFQEWKIPYPKTKDELKKLLNKEDLTSQDILLTSVFNKKSLLNIIRNYIVFEVEDNKLIKKLAKYNQFIASDKIIRRLKKHEGGVIWHTQGSGKSLAMTFTSIRIRHDNILENPTLLIVTDRTDLDDQISTTFKNCNFPNPQKVDSIATLRDELSEPRGKTIFTTIQKFQTKKGDIHPVLSENKNIIVFTDEAHRTNYGELALNLRTAIPNAIFVAFTGTPIDKKDKSTKKVFGDYIDKYLPKQAVADGATVEIKYQARLNKEHIKSSELDLKFDEEFSEYSDEEKEEIKKKYGNYLAIAESEKRIKRICKDIVNHYEEAVKPEGFKAQIVTPSKISAIKYKKFLDESTNFKSEVIISGDDHKNPLKDKLANEIKKEPIYKEIIKNSFKTKAQQKAIIKRFRKPFSGEDDLAFIIVCDMLLTGFDAPIEQVMYLDKPLKEHNLMQAVARVNRVYSKNKHFGLIIDYCGISKRLKEALNVFNDGDIGDYMQPLVADASKAETALNKLKRFFEKIAKTEKEDDYIDKCVLDVLSAKDTRIRFEKAYKEFIVYVNNLMPNQEANQFKKSVLFFGKLYNIMRQTYDLADKPNVTDACEKVKALINEYLESKGIKVLSKPVSIYSSEFTELLDKKQSDKAKASMIESKVRTTITNLMPTNPIYYTSLREKLEKMITDRQQKLTDDKELLEELNNLKDDLDPTEVAKKHELTTEEFAVYSILRNAKIQSDASEGDKKISLSKEEIRLLEEVSKDLFNNIQKEFEGIDWRNKVTEQQRMLGAIKKPLWIKLNMDVKSAENMAKTIFNLMFNIG
jgi:type I restriction enzyme, R subunit